VLIPQDVIDLLTLMDCMSRVLCITIMIEYRSYATTVSQLKICDFSGEPFKCFEVL